MLRRKQKRRKNKHPEETESKEENQNNRIKITKSKPVCMAGEKAVPKGAAFVCDEGAAHKQILIEEKDDGSAGFQ